jgi:polar amino acid transport system substrate-binding protein
MRRLHLLGAIAVLACLVTGCRFPDDPEGTLDRVTGGTLRVGVVENDPWVKLPRKGEPGGVEPILIRRFAETIDAKVEWVEGEPEELVDALAEYQLDIVVGGFTRQSPWGHEATMTRPYVDIEIEIGVPPQTELDKDLGGQEIWVERNSGAAALLAAEESDAIPRYYDSLEQVDGPALLHTYEIEELGYERTDYILRDDEHAMATPPGENAFLVELEDFLLDLDESADDLVEAEAAK